MHQPFYGDGDNRFLMPYTFLHAIKDYYDMAWYVARSNVRCSFNLVPSLVEQLEFLSESIFKDTLVYVISKHVSSLTKRERIFLQNTLFEVNRKNFIEPYSRYLSLYEKYASGGSLTDDELLDAEVLFLLAHCGYYLRHENSVVAELLDKREGFTQAEKEHILFELQEFIREILPLYRLLHRQGKISITASPFYHPIMPLLIDMDVALQAHPGVELPDTDPGFRDDAHLQLEKAIELHHRVLGNNIKGVWPPEGSVSKEVLDLFIEKNIKYTLTDEEILFKTLKKNDRSLVYRIYDYKGLKVIFRDKNLSNDISFRYCSMGAKDAVDDFISHLRAIYEYNPFNSFVSIVMDGENAWEFYSNNGFDFFEELYGRLEREDWIECVKLDDLDELEGVKIEELESVEPGSWIFSNFDVWVGKREKNRAWELLAKTKRACLDSDAGRDELLISEGSDWFWWYDDDFYTPVKDRFDALFRKHLINSCRIAARKPPVELFMPVARIDTRGYLFDQKMPVMPIIDGKLTSAFEWMEADFYISRPDEPFKFVRAERDDRFTYIALFGLQIRSGENVVLELDFPEKRIFNITVPLKNGKGDWYMVAVDEFVEMRIMGAIGFKYMISRVIVDNKVKYEQFFERLEHE